MFPNLLRAPCFPFRSYRARKREKKASARPAIDHRAISEIEQQIEETRRTLQGTASALSARLSTDEIVNEMRDYVRYKRGNGGLGERPLLLGTLGAATGAILGASLARRLPRGARKQEYEKGR